MSFVARTRIRGRAQVSHNIQGVGHRSARHPYRPVRNMAFAFTALALFAVSSFAQSQLTPSPAGTDAPSAPDTAAKTAAISGTVVDKDGAEIPNAAVVLTEGSFSLQSVSGGDGSFAFRDVPAGPYDLSVSASGFDTQHQSGILQAGQQEVIPPVQLVVATTVA